MLLIVIVVVAIAAIGILMEYNTVLSIAVALTVMTLFLYCQFTRPVPIEFWHYGGKYLLMFKNRNYAAQAARLNDAEVKECHNAYAGLPLKLESIEPILSVRLPPRHRGRASVPWALRHHRPHTPL